MCPLTSSEEGGPSLSISQVWEGGRAAWWAGEWRFRCVRVLTPPVRILTPPSKKMYFVALEKTKNMV